MKFTDPLQLLLAGDEPILACAHRYGNIPGD